MRGTVRAAFVAAMALAGCHHDLSPIHKVYVTETSSFNAEHGDVVIVVMDDPSQASIDRCLHMGGEPIYDPKSTMLYCEDVDF